MHSLPFVSHCCSWEQQTTHVKIMKEKSNPYSEPVDTDRYNYLKLVNGKI